MSRGYVLLETGSPNAQAQRLASITGIALTATGQTTILTVPTGKTLIVTAMPILITSVSGFVTAPTIRVGKASGYADILAASALTGVNQAGQYVNLLTLTAFQIMQTLVAAEVLKLDVTVGAVSTSLVATLDLYGVLV